MTPMFTLDELDAAEAVVRRHVPVTPTYSWPLLESAVGTSVWVKHENHTPVGAFKVRGGLVYVDRMVRERPAARGLVSATRGNHGQSLAFAGRVHDRPVVICVPHGNSPEKNAAMAALGAELVVHGRDFQDAREHAERVATERGYEFVPSFQRDLVVGVATYARELFTAVPDLDVVYVPVGLGSGIVGLITVRDLLGLDTEVVGVVADGRGGDEAFVRGRRADRHRRRRHVRRRRRLPGARAGGDRAHLRRRGPHPGRAGRRHRRRDAAAAPGRALGARAGGRDRPRRRAGRARRARRPAGGGRPDRRELRRLDPRRRPRLDRRTLTQVGALGGRGRIWGRRVAVVAVIAAQLTFVVRGYSTPHREFAFQMFPESSTWEADIVRVTDDGRRIPIEEPWFGYRWSTLAPDRGLSSPAGRGHADAGLRGQIAFLEAAMDWVARNTPRDTETRYLEAVVTTWHNTDPPQDEGHPQRRAGEWSGEP